MAENEHEQKVRQMVKQFLESGAGDDVVMLVYGPPDKTLRLARVAKAAPLMAAALRAIMDDRQTVLSLTLQQVTLARAALDAAEGKA